MEFMAPCVRRNAALKLQRFRRANVHFLDRDNHFPAPIGKLDRPEPLLASHFETGLLQLAKQVGGECRFVASQPALGAPPAAVTTGGIGSCRRCRLVPR